MSWILGYFGLGAVVFAGLLMDNSVRNHGSSGRLSSLMADIRRKNRSWLEFLLEEVLVGGVAAVGVIATWPLVLGFSIYFYRKKEDTQPSISLGEPEQFSVQQQDLLQSFTVSQIENREVTEDPLGAVPAVPFGHLNRAWRLFIDASHSNETLWSFRAAWRQYGTVNEWRSGYARVRNDEIVGWFTKSIKPAQDLSITGGSLELPFGSKP